MLLGRVLPVVDVRAWTELRSGAPGVLLAWIAEVPLAGVIGSYKRPCEFWSLDSLPERGSIYCAFFSQSTSRPSTVGGGSQIIF